jgi:hypothetical protein
MSTRRQQRQLGSPAPLTPVPDAGQQPTQESAERCTKWSVYRRAIEGGWGMTLRLCLILAVGVGGIGYTVVKVVSMVWGHGH